MLPQPTNALSEPSPLRFGSDKIFKGDPLGIRFSKIANEPMADQQKKKKKKEEQTLEERQRHTDSRKGNVRNRHHVST